MSFKLFQVFHLRLSTLSTSFNWKLSTSIALFQRLLHYFISFTTTLSDIFQRFQHFSVNSFHVFQDLSTLSPQTFNYFNVFHLKTFNVYCPISTISTICISTSFDVFQSISARKFQYLSTSFHCFQSMFVYDLSTSFSLFQFFQCLLLLIMSMTFIVFQQFQRFSCQCLLANVIIFRQFQHKNLSVYFNAFKTFSVFQRISTFRSTKQRHFPLANLSRHRLDSFAGPAPDGEGRCQHTRWIQNIKGYLTYQHS